MNTIKLFLSIILLLAAGYVFLFYTSAVTTKILIGGLLILTALQFLIDALEVYAWEWIKTFLTLIMVILITWYWGGFSFKEFSPVGFLLAVIIIVSLRHTDWITNLKDKRYRNIKKAFAAITILFAISIN